MVKVKICGITNLNDALKAQEAGADAVGFVFYCKSPRFILPEIAQEISQALSRKMIKIGVFVNASLEEIRRIVSFVGLDILQFHGDESVKFCQEFSDHKVIKSFRIKDKLKIDNIRQYKVYGYLFDTYSSLQKGGTGRSFDWNLLRDQDFRPRKIFLSGGLNCENVAEAIRIVRPDWVDVSSSLESSPGKKDYFLMRKFVYSAKIALKTAKAKI